MINLFDWWRRRELQRRWPSIQEAYPGFEQVQSVLLIYRLGGLAPEVLRQWEAAMPPKARLARLAFFAGRRKELDPLISDSVITRDDKNWLGLPQGDSWQQISRENYDLCIELDAGAEALLEGLRVLISTRMLVKVGGTSSEAAQIWICEDPRQEQARTAVVKYLKLINS